MMILKIIGCIAIFMIFIIIMMRITEGIIRRKQNEKIIWNMEKMDKIETLTGGLENDRLNERP